MPGLFTTFTNCRLCKAGELIEGERFVVSTDEKHGNILESTGYIGGEIVDLDDKIIAPGCFLELQANGVNGGFHFTDHGDDPDQYAQKLRETADFYITQGITGWMASIPTVSADNYHKILPQLSPQNFEGGASLLGAYAKGPYLNAEKHGAHNPELFQSIRTSLSSLYGQGFSNVKVMTLAPELPESELLIRSLVNSDVRVALGNSTATIPQGVEALRQGATCVAQAMNCMAPFHQREPGLVGLITLPESEDPKPPFYSVIADGHHVHPSVLSMLYRGAPHRCMLISDSIELAGLADGTYPGNAQVPHQQVKKGPIAAIENTNTLIGSCATVSDGVRNLVKWSGCSVAEAVRCVTENIADFLGQNDRGVLQEGRRADFVVLDDDGTVLETWVAGRQVWRAEGRQAWY